MVWTPKFFVNCYVEEAWCLLEPAWVSLRGSTTTAEEAVRATSLFRHYQNKVLAALSGRYSDYFQSHELSFLL